MGIAVSKLDEARSALQSLDPGVSRKEWIRISTAAKAAGVSYEDWHDWCARADNYAGEKDCRSNWGTIKEDGKITAGTLFHLARQGGWRPERSTPPPRPVANAKPSPRGAAPARPAARAPAAAKPAAEGAGDPHRLAKVAKFLSSAKEAPADHRYLVRKGVSGEAMKTASIADIKQCLGYHPEGKKGALEGECLLVPLHTVDGQLASMEMIDEEGRKSAVAKLARKGSCYSPVMPLPDELDRIGICEGVATCQTLNATAGHLVVSAGSQANIETLALALAQRYPRAEIVIYPDRGLTHEQEAAELASRLLGQAVALPSDVDGSDYNDMTQERGEDKVRQWLEHHQVRGGSRVRFGAARKTGRFSIPEVIPGLAVGSVGLVVGDDLGGLTALGLSIAVCAGLGRDVFAKDGSAGPLTPPQSTSAKVSVLLGADPHERLHNQLLDMGNAIGLKEEDLAVLDRDLAIHALEGVDLRLVPSMTSGDEPRPPFAAQLERICSASKLTIVAPMARLADAGGLDGGTGAAVLREAARIAKSTHSAVLLLHYDPLLGSKDPEDRRRAVWQAARYQGRLVTNDEAGLKRLGDVAIEALPRESYARIWRWHFIVDRPQQQKAAK